MTREEAFQAMKEGNKVTHRYFSEGEYLYLSQEKITTEDGYEYDDVFWNESFLKDGFDFILTS